MANEKPRNAIRTKIKAMLGRADKLYGEADGPLARLWRAILCDLNIDFDRWNRLMMSYLYTLSKDGDTPVNGKSDERGNMTKGLIIANRVSHRVFIRGLRLLRTTVARYEVTIHFMDGGKMTQSTEMHFGGGGENIGGEKESIPVPKPKTTVGKKRFFRTVQPSVLVQAGPYQKPVESMLMDPRKQVHKATGALSKIWRQILVEMDFDITQWNNALAAYLAGCEIEMGDSTSKKKSNIRGNLNKELVKKDMTMGLFLKGMAFIRADTIDFKLYLNREGSPKTTVHRIEFKAPSPLEIYQEQERKRGTDQ